MNPAIPFRAILFDFDGVLADSEPAHFRGFRRVFSEVGIDLPRDEYYRKYLGLDDRGCFEAVFRDRGKDLPLDERDRLIMKKNRIVLEDIAKNSILAPEAPPLIENFFGKYHLAIVSGAMTSEIRAILKSADLASKFHLIVGAEDVSAGKPSPEGYELAIHLLNRDFVPPAEILLPHECLVIEDSPWGIQAGKKAGCRTVALRTSYPNEIFEEADLSFSELGTIDWDQVERLFSKETA